MLERTVKVVHNPDVIPVGIHGRIRRGIRDPNAAIRATGNSGDISGRRGVAVAGIAVSGIPVGGIPVGGIPVGGRSIRRSVVAIVRIAVGVGVAGVDSDAEARTVGVWPVRQDANDGWPHDTRRELGSAAWHHLRWSNS